MPANRASGRGGQPGTYTSTGMILSAPSMIAYWPGHLKGPPSIVQPPMAIDHFGLTQPGKSWQAIEEGVIEMDGQLPINPSGGLIGCGHPVGGTGVRQLLDAYRQVTETAGGYQVSGANRVATLNIGGSGTTSVSFIVGK